MIERDTQLKGFQTNVVSLFPRCSIVGTYQCPERVFTQCIRCGRAVCLYHGEALKGQESFLTHSTCVVCLYPERYPRDPRVGRWRPYRG